MARSKTGVHSWEDVLAQRYENDKPSSLPRYRRRKGTVRGPAPRAMDFSQSPIQQSQCLLLNKLPSELRLMIWEMVLGGRRLHVIQRSQKRLGYVVCPQRDPCGICRGILPQPIKNAERCSNMNLLSLPAACKQIYRESIYLLYSSNTFEFSNTWSLTYLRPTIPADQWNEIRSVDLKWAFPGHWLPSKDSVKSVYVWAGRQQWVETCKAILLMKNLEDFTLHLTGNWFGEPIEKVPVFLEPLRGLSLKNHPHRRWKILLPPQPYYKKAATKLSDMMQKERIYCEIHEAEQCKGGCIRPN
ncbi:hypothetical protein BGW36DRAFT_383603 [Talaromyces proteolyticus]|uniref:DUF7730 domain-containing protein n=1 Tax=Talaromyces proteolyticus TaxID=1131652 RepID=A0AAD4KR40_9EURO|nr:uncharacterized protein BGW36DRAFT_383603 [Talaromyces proteolyticus]KAH8693737.1 hypothetical protein BGW36DRAFT_383603 [Talaromyces proteolyticus]